MYRCTRADENHADGDAHENRAEYEDCSDANTDENRADAANIEALENASLPLDDFRSASIIGNCGRSSGGSVTQLSLGSEATCRVVTG